MAAACACLQEEASAGDAQLDAAPSDPAAARYCLFHSGRVAALGSSGSSCHCMPVLHTASNTSTYGHVDAMICTLLRGGHNQAFGAVPPTVHLQCASLKQSGHPHASLHHAQGSTAAQVSPHVHAHRMSGVLPPTVHTRCAGTYSSSALGWFSSRQPIAPAPHTRAHACSGSQHHHVPINMGAGTSAHRNTLPVLHSQRPPALLRLLAV
jgi:hypothetical protein